jgi:hypothetical protein
MPLPNLVDSSKPNETMRGDLAKRKAAMASPAMVASVRSSLFCRSVGCGLEAWWAKTERTSAMLALMALGATRRPSCAHLG